jgi:tRNA A-37 threonylcarbamoyl transferase component Bud32
MLRSVPGRREVYDALWGDKPVIVKVFYHKINARRHLNREWKGLSLLAERGLKAPMALLRGQTEDGQWVLVVEKIPDAVTCLDAFNKATDKEQRLNLMLSACRQVAMQNEKGVAQKDLHLGNFLLKDNEFYTLDTAQMIFLRRPLTRSESISQLAFLSSYFADDEESLNKLGSDYFGVRDWQFEESDRKKLKREIARLRRRYIRKSLKKSLRTSKRFLRITTKSHIAVFDREFCRGAEPADLIKQIDSFMDGGQVLKRGNTCYVSRIKWNGKDIVIKRYNHKGLIHSLRHTLKGSRARRCWLHGHRLLMLGIATPKPLAFIEQRKDLLLWQSYLVTEYIEGPRLYDFMRDASISEQQRDAVFKQLKETLDTLATYKITHSDLKHSNILITDNGPVLIDLDAIRIHRCGWLHKNSRNKGMATLAAVMS